MAGSNFEAALARVLAHEGGYVNHPADPGGPTNFGITLATYAAFKRRRVTIAEVKAMSLDEAKAIYRKNYWDALRGDDLPAGLDYAVFDYGVNSGPGRAAKVLQRLLGLPDDGRLGDAVIAAARARDPKALIVRLCEERLAFLKSLKTWPVFGVGWSRRVAEVRAGALQMAQASAATADRLAPVPGRGEAPVNSAAQKGATGAVVVSGATAAHEAHQAGLSLFVVLAVVAVTVALAALVWLAFRRAARRRQEAPVASCLGEREAGDPRAAN